MESLPWARKPCRPHDQRYLSQRTEQSSKWLRGPKRLIEDVTLNLDESENTEPGDISEELNSNTMVSVNTDETQLLYVARWGKLSKTFRIIAWILRFVNNARGSRSCL